MDVIYVGKCKGLRNMLREKRREALSRCIKKLDSVQPHRFPLEMMLWGTNPPKQFQEIKSLMYSKCEQDALEDKI